MKKLHVILCALLLGSISVSAQKKKTHKKPVKPKVEFGIRAGANISKINGEDDYYIFSSKIGYFGGFVAKYPLSRDFALQGEVYYNMIGSKSKNHPEAEPFRDNNNIDYISVPILAQYKISPEFYVETGPEVSINVSSKNKNLDTGQVFNMKEVTKTTTFFWGIGTGYYFNENIAVNFRANIGITTPFLEGGKGAVNHFRMHNFQLGVIYFFR